MLGSVNMPQAVALGSVMQQRIPVLAVGELIGTKHMVNELKDQDPTISLQQPAGHTARIYVSIKTFFRLFV